MCRMNSKKQFMEAYERQQKDKNVNMFLDAYAVIRDLMDMYILWDMNDIRRFYRDGGYREFPKSLDRSFERVKAIVGFANVAGVITYEEFDTIFSMISTCQRRMEKEAIDADYF